MPNDPNWCWLKDKWRKQCNNNSKPFWYFLGKTEKSLLSNTCKKKEETGQEATLSSSITEQ